MNSQLQSNSLLTLNLTLKIFELRNGNRELYKSPRENKSTHPNLIIYGFSWVPLGGRQGFVRSPAKRGDGIASAVRMQTARASPFRFPSLQRSGEQGNMRYNNKSTQAHALFCIDLSLSS